MIVASQLGRSYGTVREEHLRQAAFEVAGIDATHDEMLRKVEEQTAVNEARMSMALESVDHQAVKIEEDAEQFFARIVPRDCPEWFNEEDFSQLKLIRDQWI